jgi:hypothetical protein
MSSYNTYTYNIELFQFYINEDKYKPTYDKSITSNLYYKLNPNDDNLYKISYNTLDEETASYQSKMYYNEKYDYEDYEEFKENFDELQQKIEYRDYENKIKEKSNKYILLKIELIDDYNKKYNYIILIKDNLFFNMSIDILTENYDINFKNNNLSLYNDELFNIISDINYNNQVDNIFNRRILYIDNIVNLLSNLSNNFFIQPLLYILINKFTYPKDWTSPNINIDHNNSSIKYNLNNTFKEIIYNELINTTYTL